ncbi:MAG: sigma-70 family RNA polymerase sigma factor [Roseiflexaceae bacterium]|nr:sigma-70 family RNA polymerase sigma factor [Roseiflexaceae bacterium]
MDSVETTNEFESDPPDAPVLATLDEQRLVEALRNGDEDAFTSLVMQYQNSMLRIAHYYVGSSAAAEDVVQETWLGVLRGLDNFAGRSSLRTWIFRILTNRAKTRGIRDGRTIPFASLQFQDDEASEPIVNADRFWPADHPQWANVWVSYPRSWGQFPEDRALAAELQAVIQHSIEMLPPNQRAVISLRDIEGISSEEVCNVLEISESNQRVLLHRARAKVRRAVEQYQNEASIA